MVFKLPKVEGTVVVWRCGQHGLRAESVYPLEKIEQAFLAFARIVHFKVVLEVDSGEGKSLHMFSVLL